MDRIHRNHTSLKIARPSYLEELNINLDFPLKNTQIYNYTQAPPNSNANTPRSLYKLGLKKKEIVVEGMCSNIEVGDYDVGAPPVDYQTSLSILSHIEQPNPPGAVYVASIEDTLEAMHVQTHKDEDGSVTSGISGPGNSGNSGISGPGSGTSVPGSVPGSPNTSQSSPKKKKSDPLDVVNHYMYSCPSFAQDVITIPLQQTYDDSVLLSDEVELHTKKKTIKQYNQVEGEVLTRKLIDKLSICMPSSFSQYVSMKQGEELKYNIEQERLEQLRIKELENENGVTGTGGDKKSSKKLSRQTSKLDPISRKGSKATNTMNENEYNVYSINNPTARVWTAGITIPLKNVELPDWSGLNQLESDSSTVHYTTTMFSNQGSGQGSGQGIISNSVDGEDVNSGSGDDMTQMNPNQKQDQDQGEGVVPQEGQGQDAVEGVGVEVGVGVGGDQSQCGSVDTRSIMSTTPSVTVHSNINTNIDTGGNGSTTTGGSITGFGSVIERPPRNAPLRNRTTFMQMYGKMYHLELVSFREGLKPPFKIPLNTPVLRIGTLENACGDSTITCTATKEDGSIDDDVLYVRDEKNAYKRTFPLIARTHCVIYVPMCSDNDYTNNITNSLIPTSSGINGNNGSNGSNKNNGSTSNGIGGSSGFNNSMKSISTSSVDSLSTDDFNSSTTGTGTGMGIAPTPTPTPHTNELCTIVDNHTFGGTYIVSITGVKKVPKKTSKGLPMHDGDLLCIGIGRVDETNISPTEASKACVVYRIRCVDIEA